MKAVFFYGLFMDEELLKKKGLNPQKIRPACLKGYGLRIAERATLEQSESESSYGTVMQLTQHELATLYDSDGVADYLPKTVTIIETNGKTTEVESYILPMDKTSGRNSQYAQSLAAVAKKLKLPDDYIKEIETWI